MQNTKMAVGLNICETDFQNYDVNQIDTHFNPAPNDVFLFSNDITSQAIFIDCD